MPRSVDFTIDIPASVEQIHSAFSDEGYWLARLAAFGGVGRLESLVIDGDGRVIVTVIHDVDQGGLPRIVAKVYPARWQVVQKEMWIPADADSVRGEVSLVTHGAPGSGNGTALLAPTKDGSRLDCTATVEFSIPLVGGKVESLVGHSLPGQFSMLEQFTTKWINER